MERPSIPLSLEVILVILASLPGAGPAWAADDERCRTYASRALEEFAEGQRPGCPGLSYPVWSMDFDHHYAWCRRVSEEEVRAGGQMRTDALDGCRQTAPKGNVTGVTEMVDPQTVMGAASEQPCLGYAATALAQQAEDLERGCGLTGPQWNAEAEDLSVLNTHPPEDHSTSEPYPTSPFTDDTRDQSQDSGSSRPANRAASRIACGPLLPRRADPSLLPGAPSNAPGAGDRRADAEAAACNLHASPA